MDNTSLLQKKRTAYQPSLPSILNDLNHIIFKPVPIKEPLPSLKPLFPKTFHQKAYSLEKGSSTEKKSLKIGVVFSGGQAAGGHNVIAGLFDAVKLFHSNSQIIGFLDGPGGIIQNQWVELSEKKIAPYRNQGGFDLIGSGRTKIETADQLASSLKTVQEHGLGGLVIIGGDDSNTNAAILAEYFLEKGCGCKVIGVPKTIDGDLRSKEIEISFGFDTACKIYSEIIGNIARDALSAKKYYHFIKLMGRSASHVSLECALATHPNLALIGEEKKSLSEIVKEIADLVCRRAEAGKNYGIVLIPEGLIEFIPEMKELIAVLNQAATLQMEDVEKHLKGEQKAFFASLPEKFKKQLLLDRDPHGNIQVSQIETEQLLMELVKKELKKRTEAKAFKGKFSAQEHFVGYEGRAGMPSNFDANYCYALGTLAALSVHNGLTGMICSIQNLKRPPQEWRLMAVPIVHLMHLETRLGKEKPVIQKALVDLKSEAFLVFAKARKSWEIDDSYRYPGPIQFFGDLDLTDSVPFSLK